MANLYLNAQNIIENSQQINLHLSGMHTIINKKSNITMYNDIISGTMIADSSNIIIGSNVNLYIEKLNNHIFATNNSKITTLNNQQQIFVNNNNGASYNFNLPDNNIPPISCLTTYQTTQPLVYETDKKELKNQQWNPYLVNDGNKFIWYKTDKINDYYLTDNKNVQLAFMPLNNISKFNQQMANMPKNLYGKTLTIHCPNTTNTQPLNGVLLTISGFYNGTIKIIGDGIKNRIIYCSNIQNLEIISDKSTYITNYIKLQNIENCIIDGLSFGKADSIVETDYANIDNIRNKFNYNYQIQKLKADNWFKLNIVNSNVVLRNCRFGTCKQTVIYCTLNSKLTAYNNYFNFGGSNNFKRRPICYYISKNSFCTAYGDKIQIEYNTQNAGQSTSIELLYDTQQLNNSIQKQLEKYKSVVTSYDNDTKTFIYGFAYPGSIFNHEHKSKLLTRQTLNNADLIAQRQLPIGSMYQIPKKLANNILHGTEYATSSTIGYHQSQLTSAYIGTSYQLPIPGYFTYKIYVPKNSEHSNVVKAFNNTLTAMQKQLNKLNSQKDATKKTIFFPQISAPGRYKSDYAENIKYSKILRHHFNLNTCPYFNHALLNTNMQDSQYNTLHVSVPSALYGTIPSAYQTDQYDTILAIQYSQFVNFDKTIFKTNIED